MTIDRVIYETKNKIVNLLNDSGLSLRTISYILGDIKQEAENKANEQLNLELLKEAEQSKNNLENEEEVTQ